MNRTSSSFGCFSRMSAILSVCVFLFVGGAVSAWLMYVNWNAPSPVKPLEKPAEKRAPEKRENAIVQTKLPIVNTWQPVDEKVVSYPFSQIYGDSDLSLEDDTPASDSLAPKVFGRADDESLRAVKDFHLMKALNVSASNVTDVGLALLAPLPNLEKLVLKRTKVTGTGFGQAGFKKLKELYLNRSPVTDEGLAEIAGIDTLEKLYLERTLVKGTGLSQKAGFKNLKELDLTSTKVTDGHLVAIDGLVNLEVLTLTSSSGVGFAKVTGLRKLRKLKLASWNELSDEGLAQLKSLSGLESVSISGARISAPGVAALQHLPKLKEAYIDSEALAGSRLEELASLKNLERLILRFPLNDAGLKQLGKLSQVRHVYFKGEKFSADAGNLREMKNLRRIAISSPKMTDAVLLQLLHGTEVKVVKLWCPLVTRDGLEKLIQAMPKLEELYLPTTSVTDEGRKVLRAAYPRLFELRHPSYLFPY